MKLIPATFCLLALQASQSQAAITVTDDQGNVVTLARPAQRVITLAPHVTELVFAAGGGDKIIGTVKYSDYPEAAKAIPRIGDLRQFDMEKIIALKPDLLVVWMHGAFDQQLQVLRQSGIPFYFSEPHTLDQIPRRSANWVNCSVPEKRPKRRPPISVCNGSNCRQAIRTNRRSRPSIRSGVALYTH